MQVIDQIVERTKKIASGQDDVKPGQQVGFTEACVAGDAIRQGDLYLIIRESVPPGYEKVGQPKAIDKQLVPGNTVGAKHCLDALAGVEIFRLKNWNEESLDGPYLRISKERTVLHPTHGAVVIPAGFTVECRYQREFDREQQRERRARD